MNTYDFGGKFKLRVCLDLYFEAKQTPTFSLKIEILLLGNRLDKSYMKTKNTSECAKIVDVNVNFQGGRLQTESGAHTVHNFCQK